MQINLCVLSGRLLLCVTRIFVVIFITSPQFEAEQIMISFWDKFKIIKKRWSVPRLSKYFFSLVFFLTITTSALTTRSVLANDNNAVQFTGSSGVNADVLGPSVQKTLAIRSAAVAEFSQTSADGCVITSGEIVAMQVLYSDGDELNDDGVIVVGMQEDLCAGTGNGFAGFEPLPVTVRRLASAHVQGTMVVPSYSSGDPVTIELDLHFTGYGAITRERDFNPDGPVIEFSFNRSRTAEISGTFTLDGENVDVTSASIVKTSNGTILR